MILYLYFSYTQVISHVMDQQPVIMRWLTANGWLVYVFFLLFYLPSKDFIHRILLYEQLGFSTWIGYDLAM